MVRRPKNGIKERKLRKLIGCTSLIIGLLLLPSWGYAIPMNSTPILLIDGTGDDNMEVTVSALDLTSGYDFGYLDNGSFVSIIDNGDWLGAKYFDGGFVVDFAIRNVNDNSVYSLGTDANGNNPATLYFFGSVPAGYSEYPVVTEDYYTTVFIAWDVDGDGQVDAEFDLVTAKTPGSYDGLLPAYAVPEGSSMIYMGFGLVGIWGMRNRLRREEPV